MTHAPWQLLVGHLFWLSQLAAAGQSLIITNFSVAPTPRLSVAGAFTSKYYVLYRGEQASDIRLPTDVTLGKNGFADLVDASAVPERGGGFYRVEQVPVGSPRDLDGDGIDDVFELRHRTSLNPLDATDAVRDADMDGRSNLVEYLAGTNPFIVDLPADSRQGLRLSARRGHSLALQTDGTLWAWGENYAGQLGDGTTTRRLSPVQVATNRVWVAVSTGKEHTLALATDGSLWGWGSNNYGELGLKQAR